MNYFGLMKYGYTVALAGAIATLITAGYANPAGDALVGVLAISVFVMMRGEAKLRKAEVRIRYFRNRYREEVTARLEYMQAIKQAQPPEKNVAH